MSERIAVSRTAKLFIGGAFPRSESGRTYPAATPDGTPIANAAMASRKDARDAVVAARKAAAGWAGRTAYNRGQILYRVAELLEGRREQVAHEVAQAEGCTADEARSQVDAAVDRWVWYAGWTDKIAQVFGNANPVAGPYFNVSTPEPVGVVAALAPQVDSILGLTEVMAAPIAGGSTVVVVAAERHPLPAVSLSEILAAADIPAGVVNVLTGITAELAPILASHMDVGAIDLTGAAVADVAALREAAAGSTKRVTAVPLGQHERDGESTMTSSTWQTVAATARMRGALELKTVWHPAGV